MTKKSAPNAPLNAGEAAANMPTKHQQVVELLLRNEGASLEEMSTLTNWLTHSTRAFLTGLKKKGYEVISDKVDGVRRYKIGQKA
jgi:hypothetical protein